MTQPDGVVALDLERPPEFGRMDDWFGVWAMEERAFHGLLSQVANGNLAEHVRATLAARGSKTDAPTSSLSVRDGIAVLNISGTMMKAESSWGGSTSTVRVRNQLRQALADDSVNGVLLVIDSPGGTVAGTVDLADEVANATGKKPVWAYVEDQACSAAFYVGSQAERVLMNRAGVTGSIGVFTGVVDSSARAASELLKVHVIRSGVHKGAGMPGTPITDAQLAEFQSRVDAQAQLFVDAVARGRKLARDKVSALADGRVFTGEQAVTAGLVDAVQSLDDTFAAFVARLKPKSKGGPMSTDTKPGPQAATLAELKAACPGADASFLMGQLEGNATVEAATKAWMTTLAKQRDEALAATAKAEAQAKEKPPAQPVGVKPLGTQPQGQEQIEETGDAVSRFSALVAELQGTSKLSRQQAVLAAARKNPELHRAYIEACNA